MTSVFLSFVTGFMKTGIAGSKSAFILKGVTSDPCILQYVKKNHRWPKSNNLCKFITNNYERFHVCSLPSEQINLTLKLN